MLNIGSDRECFWDEYLIDPAKTTAEFLVHHPVRREAVIRHDAPWEGDGCNYHCVFRDGGVYRMYYNANEMISSDKQQHTVEDNKICYAESRDCLNWTKPTLRALRSSTPAPLRSSRRGRTSPPRRTTCRSSRAP